MADWWCARMRMCRQLALYSVTGLPKGVLYSYGKISKKLGGFSSNRCAISMDADAVTFTNDTSISNSRFTFRSDNKVLISGYTTLRFVVYINNPASQYQFGITESDVLNPTNSDLVKSKSNTSSGGKTQTIDVDVSGVNGEYYIAGSRNSANTFTNKIYEIKLL